MEQISSGMAANETQDDMAGNNTTEMWEKAGI
jgi:hypothetical protein